jgi:hypothetical protein
MVCGPGWEAMYRSQYDPPKVLNKLLREPVTGKGLHMCGDAGKYPHRQKQIVSTG